MAPDAVRPLALVTGAGRRIGIGAACVQRLAQDGFDVAWTSWPSYDARMPWGADDDAAEDLTAAVTAVGGRPLHVEADLAVAGAVDGIFDRLATELGRPPTCLVLCHAESVDSGLLDTTVDSFDRHYAVNVRATWELVRAFAGHFPQGASGGRIVAMTSDHTVGNVPYGATKGALDRIVVAAAQELAHLRVTANVVNPGPTDTGWMSDELKRAVIAQTPLGRVGTPADAANLVSFLCSPGGGWINGQLLTSNGGGA